MRKFLLVLLLLGLILSTTSAIHAARKRVRPQPGAISASVSSSVRFREDRRAIIISLSNLNKASSVTYSLTYTTGGIPQGAQGTITPTGENSAVREILFGTCSKNVCTYHTNIANARLEIVSKLKTGRIIVKPYRLKV